MLENLIFIKIFNIRAQITIAEIHVLYSRADLTFYYKSRAVRRRVIIHRIDAWVRSLFTRGARPSCSVRFYGLSALYLRYTFYVARGAVRPDKREHGPTGTATVEYRVVGSKTFARNLFRHYPGIARVV